MCISVLHEVKMNIQVYALFLALFCGFTARAQLSSATSQVYTSSLPVTYPATVIAGGEQTCPAKSDLDKVRANITQDVSSMVQSMVLPQICRSNLGQDQENPAASCQKIAECNSSASSGDYWLRSGNGSAVQMFCNMTRRCCNSAGGWTRVAYLDMTDPTHQCPAAWREITEQKRTCGRTNDTLIPKRGGCSTVTFNSNGITYSRVCGRITAYQFAHPNAFGPYTNTRNISGTIYDPYVDGVVVTHGDPRMHVWTFAGAYMYDQNRTGNGTCPCANADNQNILIPPWVGEDYFCETGVNDDTVETFYPNDPLWDGENCSLGSTCCEFNNPPWFCKKLDAIAVSDIEVSMCGNADFHSEDTPIELIEIYIQ